MTQPTHMALHDLQQSNERQFCRKHINSYIDTAIRENLQNEAKVILGIQLVTAWATKSYFPSKDARIAQLSRLNIEQLVRDIYIGIAYAQQEELFVTITAQLAAKLGFTDHKDSIRTIAEIVAVLSSTDAFDIVQASRNDSLRIVSRLYLPLKLKEAIDRSLYIPPMVCEPLEVKTNSESPYLTFNESQILGRGNHHAEDICLDVINIQNKVALRLASNFISKVEEEPSYALDTLEKIQHWSNFKQQSYFLYLMLVQQGNKFWITHKVDKRLRMYASGYHINTQGSAFKKASLELFHQEKVNGVPQM